MVRAIDFYFDFSSPYGYFASTRIDELAAKHGRSVNWRPVLLGPVFKATGGMPLTDWPLKGNYSIHDFERTARLHNIPYKRPQAFPVSTAFAARAMLWLRQSHGEDKAVEFAKAVYRGYFSDGVNISEPASVAAIASAIGLDAVMISEGANCAPIRDRFKEDVDAAMVRGVFGSPFIIVDNEPFWGFDRFYQIEAYLQEEKTKSKRGYKDLIDEAMAQVKTYSVAEAKAKFGDPEVQFVDVRDVRELEREGVIPGAFHAPRGMIEFWVDPDSPYFKPVFGEKKEFILFCAAGWRSALTAKTMQDMGRASVAHIDGGFGAWKAAGAAVSVKENKS